MVLSTGLGLPPRRPTKVAGHRACQQDGKNGMGPRWPGASATRNPSHSWHEGDRASVRHDVKVGKGKQHVMQSRSIGDQDNPLVPLHCRMRVYDRDLIRGGYYGQRSCEPHPASKHMAAPTSGATWRFLANPEPPTNGKACFESTVFTEHIEVDEFHVPMKHCDCRHMASSCASVGYERRRQRKGHASAPCSAARSVGT